MPIPRTEVAAATVGNEIVVLGGLSIDGGASRRADAYSPARDTWRRLPDIPIGVHHSIAVGAGGRLYVIGGYTAAGGLLRTAFVLERGRWRSLPRMPFPRAAAGAGAAGRRIIVAGGIGAGRRLARNALSFDLVTNRWSVIAGPTPARAPGSYVACRHRLRGRRSNCRPRHQPPRLRELQAGRPRLAQAFTRPRSPRRHRRRGSLGRDRLCWRRGACGDDRRGSGVPSSRPALGGARRTTDPAPRRRRGRFRWSRIRHRRRTGAWPNRQRGQRSAGDLALEA